MEGSFTVAVWCTVAGPLCAAGGYTAMGFCGQNVRSASVHRIVVPHLCFLQCTTATVLLLPAPVFSPAAPLALALCRQQASVSEVASGAEGCDVCMKRKWWELSVPNSLSLVTDTPPWTPVASAAAWGWTATTGYLSGQMNMQEAREQTIQKDGRSRRLEGLLPTHTQSHLHIQCTYLSLAVLAIVPSAEVRLHQWPSCSCHLFHEEWQNTTQKGNWFPILGFQGICLPFFTSWCPLGSVGKLTPFTMWLLVNRILIHS